MERYCRTIHRDPLCDTYQRLQLRENSCCTLESVPPMLISYALSGPKTNNSSNLSWPPFYQFYIARSNSMKGHKSMKLDQNRSQLLYFQLFVYVVLEAGAWWSSCSWCPDPGILTIHLEIRGETWLAISPSPPTSNPPPPASPQPGGTLMTLFQDDVLGLQTLTFDMADFKNT